MFIKKHIPSPRSSRGRPPCPGSAGTEPSTTLKGVRRAGLIQVEGWAGRAGTSTSCARRPCRARAGCRSAGTRRRSPATA